jgi:hypothetical protein
MWKWRYRSTILDLGTRWRWVVRFTTRPLYSREKSLSYPLDRRLSGPQSRSAGCGEEINSSSAGTRTPAVQPVAIPTELFRILTWSSVPYRNPALHYGFKIAGIDPRSGHVGFVVDKAALGGRLPPSTSISPSNSNFTNCSASINHLFIDVV